LNGASSTLEGRLKDVRGRLARAAARAGRDAGSVRLVGVCKTVPADRVADAVALGLADLGENRVQEARDKIAAVGREGVRWHMIGHLQRNKAALAVELFDRIHGLDSPALADAVSRRAVGVGRRLPALVEVNVSGEASKHGVRPDDAAALIGHVAALPGIALDGLMTIAPYSDDPEDARPHFARLRELRDALERECGVRLPELSMGMSGDFEVAVEEGSTLVRVGTAIFGERPGPWPDGGAAQV
jgi:pyridoxal phosphate enzyme (YggS family)